MPQILRSMTRLHIQGWCKIWIFLWNKREATSPLQWIKLFLSNRAQRFVVESSHSTPCKDTSGVLQGSVLGPTLFLIYINDLVTHIQCSTAVSFIIPYLHLLTTCNQILQDDLQKLSAWADKWEMKFNINKCCIIQLSKHRHIKVNFYAECQVRCLELINNILI